MVDAVCCTVAGLMTRKVLDTDEAFVSNLASGGPFTLRIEVDANPDGRTFGGVAYVELGKRDPDPEVEAERVIRYALVGTTRAIDSVSACTGAATLALSWLEHMDRLAEAQPIVDAGEDEPDPPDHPSK